jgi:NAD(P)-dependent dehydrogenase (short-subunit alcohol dehydrogenase family)
MRPTGRRVRQRTVWRTGAAPDGCLISTHLGRQTADQVISEPDVQRHTVSTAVRPSLPFRRPVALFDSGRSPKRFSLAEVLQRPLSALATAGPGTSIWPRFRDIARLRAIADQGEAEFGKIDIVVANAAIHRWKGLMDMDDADWRNLIDNSLNGTANTIRAFAPKMLPRKYGRIIVLSSIAAETGGVIDPHYAAS